LLKPEHFRQTELIFESLDDDFLTRIQKCRRNKDRVVEKALLNHEKMWKEHEDGPVTWQNRIYVPKNRKLREDIIHEHHDSRTKPKNSSHVTIGGHASNQIFENT
jgi:hypothetical protein